MQRNIDNYPNLKYKILKDLTTRSRGGIIIYLLVWFIMATWADIIHGNPKIFYFNSLLFIGISAMRATHSLLHRNKPDLNTSFMYNSLVFLILLGACHWGILSAWVIFGGSYQELHYPYMVVLAAFAVGGTNVLSISRLISILYPLFIFVPTLIMGWIVGGTENHILSLLAFFSVIYILEASRASHKDYHEAIFNHVVAEERATMLEKQSTTDQLTGLKNRLYFNDKFAEQWSSCSRSQVSISILMIDLDHFKKINDTFGHISGDECLKRVAMVLQSQINRSTDTVARYGGEEFVIILPDTDIVSAAKIAGRLVNAISKINLQLNSTIVSVSCSIGVASTIPSHLDNAENLLILADNALYQAKAQGRNRYRISNALHHIADTEGETI